jgi:hypothetical protein
MLRIIATLFDGFNVKIKIESLVKVMSKSNYFEFANAFYTDRPSLFTKLKI